MASGLTQSLKRFDEQIERWLKLTEGWTDQEKAHVLIGWLGTERAQQMNNHIARIERQS